MRIGAEGLDVRALAGALDRQITIEYPDKTQDDTYGTEIVTWKPLVTTGDPPVAMRFRASVKDMVPSRSDAVTQGLPVARDQTRVRLRWRDDIRGDMRVIVHGDHDTVYQIVGGPAEVGDRKSLIELVCERYAA